jgi:predicted nucleic acid-binding protein
MSADVFLDSNVLIYLFDETDVRKSQRAEDVVRQSLETGRGCISHQVVQETINVVTRKLDATREDAREFLDRVLIPLWNVNPTPALYRRALDVQQRYGFSFYDSLILAAGLEAGCKTLYSEDLQHGQQVEGLTIVDPFRSPPVH